MQISNLPNRGEFEWQLPLNLKINHVYYLFIKAIDNSTWEFCEKFTVISSPRSQVSVYYSYIMLISLLLPLIIVLKRKFF